MRRLLDCHCHTLASGHAYSTIAEYANAASEKGLSLIAITDHGPDMPGSTHLFYFQNLKILPEIINGVRVLKGAEVNIINYQGGLDLPDSVMSTLDICIASFHTPCLTPGTIEQNTFAFIKAMENPYIQIIGHPDDARVPVDYQKLVNAAKENNVALEVNNSSLLETAFRVNAKENYAILLKLCKEKRVPIIISSDAHYHMDVGRTEAADKILESIDFPDDLILNTSLERFKTTMGTVLVVD